MAETTPAILSNKQRRFLDPDDNYEPKAPGQMRRRIHEQVFATVAVDGPILFSELDRDDREEIFKPKKVANGTAASEEVRARKAREWAEADRGAPDLLAFLYLAFSERFGTEAEQGFEHVLKLAMERVADEKGWVVDSYEFDVEFTRHPPWDEWLEKFEAGFASMEEAFWLLDSGRISAEEFAEYVDEELG